MVATPALYCDLCGLPAPKPVEHFVGAEAKNFCCEGCATVYELAAEQNLLDQVLATPGRKKASIRSMVPQGESAFFLLRGMWCPGCATAAQRILETQPGVNAAEVSFAAERGRIWFDPEKTSPNQAVKDLRRLGYDPFLFTAPKEGKAGRHQQLFLLQFIAAASFGMWVMLLYIAYLYHYYGLEQFNVPEVRNMQYLVLILTTPIVFFAGISFPMGAYRAAKARTATMDTLVTLGLFSAYFYSIYIAFSGSGQAYFDSVAMIVTFVMLGRYLEAAGSSAARKDISYLLTIQPDSAWRRAGGNWERVPAKDLAPGDAILVKPGERIPVDAVVTEGYGAVDESVLTGESVPVTKGPGDTLDSGTLLTDSALICEVRGSSEDTKLSQITKLVETTLSTKPPLQRAADKASAWLTLIILGVSALTLLGWWLAGYPFPQALLTAVAVLVIACPCALGLATPLAIVTSLGKAVRAGILLRSPAALEMAGTTKHIVFDKTGTLTQGKLSVTEVHEDPHGPLSKLDILKAASGVEQYSEHPIARAIVRLQSSAPPAAGKFEVARGLGARADVDGFGRVTVGSLGYAGVEPAPNLVAAAEARAEQGETVVWVGYEGKAAGFIALRDEPDPSAVEVLRKLKSAGIDPIMLSGDLATTTEVIAKELGLSDFEGGCSPLDKITRIQAWQQNKGTVAMVGDGVNDAPAMAVADLSIAVASGTAIAGEAADVMLTRHDLGLIPQFIDLSRRTKRMIDINLAWAFSYNLVAVPLAAFGLISPVIAAAAMASSSVMVVLNTLRLRRAL